MNDKSNDVISFGELSDDEPFKKSVKSFNNSVAKISDVLKTICDSDIYAQLDNEYKVKYDLFLSYSLNSLFWLYLRTQGHDPNDHNIKKEIERVKGYMAQAKKAEERKLMPTVDQEAAQRFVRNALWTPAEKDSTLDEAVIPNKRKRSD